METYCFVVDESNNVIINGWRFVSFISRVHNGPRNCTLMKSLPEAADEETKYVIYPTESVYFMDIR